MALTDPGVVWINGSGKHHDSRQCAGQDAVPVFEEFVAGSESEPCGLCEPRTLVACDECGERYASEQWLKRHHYQDHLRGSESKAAVPEGDDSWRELDQKARERGEADA